MLKNWKSLGIKGLRMAWNSLFKCVMFTRPLPTRSKYLNLTRWNLVSASENTLPKTLCLSCLYPQTFYRLILQQMDEQVDLRHQNETHMLVSDHLEPYTTHAETVQVVILQKLDLYVQTESYGKLDPKLHTRNKKRKTKIYWSFGN